MKKLILTILLVTIASVMFAVETVPGLNSSTAEKIGYFPMLTTQTLECNYPEGSFLGDDGAFYFSKENWKTPVYSAGVTADAIAVEAQYAEWAKEAMLQAWSEEVNDGIWCIHNATTVVDIKYGCSK